LEPSSEPQTAKPSNPSVSGSRKEAHRDEEGRRHLASADGSHAEKKRRFMIAVGGGMAVPLEFEEGAASSALAK
jgi:hypothetical protein